MCEGPAWPNLLKGDIGTSTIITCNLLASLIRARYSTDKIPPFECLNAELEVLRYQTRLCRDFNLLDMWYYEHVSGFFQHWCTKIPARKTGGNYSSCILIYVVYFHFHNHNQDVTATEMQVQSSGSPRRTGGICRKKLYDYASTITSTSTIAPIRGSCSYSYFVIEMIREKTK
ncbi:MAG: hypothetical protein BWX80_03255 [Candidatus Hydrogenedentes bacterium ADurb.Bin101]|nr:MAG: hypothetical protein BWX80_03255 [Candidatus Hydrogenedentes bacterium ADurb.Bin101]HOH28802.1 hypothetical protein [Candidatus Hydrogenedentota bacterium]